MELRIESYETPAKIGWNFEELKAEISAKVQHYEMLVYDEEQIKVAKADKAALNKLKKALNDERIKQEREYMKSFNEFKAQVNEIIRIIDKPITTIDSQLKAYEEKRIAEKQLVIAGVYEEVGFPEWVKPVLVIQDNWTNASVSVNAIKSALQAQKAKIIQDVATLSQLPEFAFEAIETYKQALDINKALYEAYRLSELKGKKEELEKAVTFKDQSDKVAYGKQPETVTPDSEKQWLSFSALLSIEDAQALKELFLTRNIQFKQI